MSKILKAGDLGFGLLIESDSGYVDIGLNPHVLNENFEIKENEPVLINCILQKWGVKNKNGRRYPKDVLIPQVNEYMEIVKNNGGVGESDHPDSSIISLQNISHLITKMWWGKGEQENVLFGELKIIVSPGFIKYGIVSVVGDKILLYLRNNIRLGISSRGVGSLKDVNGENMVQNDFELIGFDLVATPSTPGAFLFPDKNKFQEKPNNISSKDLNENNKLLLALNKFLL